MIASRITQYAISRVMMKPSSPAVIEKTHTRSKFVMLTRYRSLEAREASHRAHEGMSLGGSWSD